MPALGYLYKRVASPPDWLTAPGVTEVCALSCCVSEAFGDYSACSGFNGFGLFDSPALMIELARREGWGLDGCELFYYEACEEQYNDGRGAWEAFSPMPGLITQVEPPASARFIGCDVVTFSTGTFPECSPLSCNGLAQQLDVNAQCLFGTEEAARIAIASGTFANGESGPLRIVAVYRVPQHVARM